MDVGVADATAIEVTLDAEAILAGVDLSAARDTDGAPEALRSGALRALPPEALAGRARAAFPEFARGPTLGGPGPPELASAAVGAEDDPALPRDTRPTIRAALASEAPSIGWDARFGALIPRQKGAGEDGLAGPLAGERTSPPLALPAEGGAAERPWRTFARDVASGFEHIVPRGAGHVLFVPGLSVFPLALRPLLWQVTAFTLAHTATQAPATLGAVSVPAAVVEPLIAPSIAHVGIENALRPRLGWWRPAAVFGFGLLHGPGFAWVLSDVGGGTSDQAARLVGFDVGVRLAVIGAALALLALPFGRGRHVRAAVPAMGPWWAPGRTVGA